MTSHSGNNDYCCFNLNLVNSIFLHYQLFVMSVIYHFQIWNFDVVTLLNISNIKMLASFA